MRPPSDKLEKSQEIYSLQVLAEEGLLEGLYWLKFILEQDDLLCKIDLKETYSSVSLNKNSQKILDFNSQATYTKFFSYVLDLGQLQWLLQSY